MPAGYSGTPLIDKLGFKPGMRVIFPGAPPHYPDLLGALPDGTDVRARLVGGFDLIHLFAARRAHFEKQLPRVARALRPAGILWISWPKKTSRLAVDLGENDIRNTVLGRHPDLVDVKICAVDEDWSGLKFMVRREARSSRQG